MLPLGNLLNLQGSRFEPQSQRDCASKPRVARNELPWVMHLEISNPNGVVALCDGSTQPRGVAAIRATVDLIAPSQTCGWTTQSLALKMCIMFRSPLRSAAHSMRQAQTTLLRLASLRLPFPARAPHGSSAPPEKPSIPQPPSPRNPAPPRFARQSLFASAGSI